MALADTKAEAKMDGKIYAGGDVKVESLNTVDKSDGGTYAADTTKASTMSGESGLAPTVNPVKEKVMPFFKRIKEAIKGSGASKKASEKLWNKLGINAATAVLRSSNDATSAVTGSVRGIKDLPKEQQVEGNVPFAADDTVGAKSLSVKAENVARVSGKTVLSKIDLLKAKILIASP